MYDSKIRSTTVYAQLTCLDREMSNGKGCGSCYRANEII